MTTLRIENTLAGINENSKTYIIYGNTKDIFCDNNLIISDLKFQIYNNLKKYNQRLVFLEKDKTYFLDKKSCNLFLEQNDSQLQLVKGPLNNLQIIKAQANSEFMQKLFYYSFIDQIEYFLEQNTSSVYICDLYSFNKINDLFSGSNNTFIVLNETIDKISLIKESDNYKFLEITKPFKDEVVNLLNYLAIKNDLKTNYGEIDITILKFDSLMEFYHKLKDYHNAYIELEKIFVQKENKDNTTWLEF